MAADRGVSAAAGQWLAGYFGAPRDERSPGILAWIVSWAPATAIQDSREDSEQFLASFRNAFLAFILALVSYVLSILNLRWKLNIHLERLRLSRRPHATSENVDDEDEPGESVIRSLAFHLSAFVSSCSLLWFIALCCSTVLIIEDLPIPHVLNSIDESFVHKFWSTMHWLTSTALFFIFPFAFMYDEAEGILSSGGFVSRVLETVIVLLMLMVLVQGSFGLILSLLTGSWLFSITSYTHGLAYQIPGLLCHLGFSSIGFVELTKRAISLWIGWTRPPSAEALDILDWEETFIAERLEILKHRTESPLDRRLNGGFTSAARETQAEADALAKRLGGIRERRLLELAKPSVLRQFSENSICCVAVLLSVWFPVMMVFQGAMQCQTIIARGLYRLLGYDEELLHTPLSSHVFAIFLGYAPPPLLVYGLELSLVAYLLLATRTGLLRHSILSDSGLLQSLSYTQIVLVQNCSILLLCSTLGESTCILGISSIKLETLSPESRLLRKGLSRLLCSLAFVVFAALRSAEAARGYLRFGLVSSYNTFKAWLLSKNAIIVRGRAGSENTERMRGKRWI